jgi:hypothetical protein
MSDPIHEMRLQKMHRMLEKLFGIELNLNVKNINKLKVLSEKYSGLKERILRESGFNSYYQNPEYVKAILILESINIFLSEVAPKRISKKSKRNNGS